MAQKHPLNETPRSQYARIKRLQVLLSGLAGGLERAQKLPPRSRSKQSAAKPRLLSPKQASDMLGLSVKTLANLRSTGTADLPYREDKFAHFLPPCGRFTRGPRSRWRSALPDQSGFR